jgi:hypothetical protein
VGVAPKDGVKAHAGLKCKSQRARPEIRFPSNQPARPLGILANPQTVTTCLIKGCAHSATGLSMSDADAV